MRLLKSFLSFTMPLMIMLLTFLVFLFVTKVVDNYKYNITDDYSILIISNTPLTKIDEVANLKVKELVILQRKKIIDDIKDNVSESSLKVLSTKLPYFYKLYLNEFPTSSKLEQIRKELTTISNIKRVETFSNDHNKIYSILILIQNIVLVLFIVILALAALLLWQQIKIWMFEHKERINIIQLHGGSIFYSSKPILKVMFLSTLFSSIIVCLIAYFVLTNIATILQPEITSLIPSFQTFQFDLIKILFLAFIIPFIAFMGLLIKYKIK
ncbi:MAG: cell division protein FtsX [Campylobacterota bacterium]|nr:cell division protein FtsX [Campylobacterota bacterium]